MPEDVGQILSFKTDPTRLRLEIVDHIERDICILETSDQICPEEIATEVFHFPVDQGVSIRTKRLSLNHSTVVFIRNDSGLLLDELTSESEKILPFDKYIFGFAAPIKLYFAIESEVSITVTEDHVDLEFGDLTTVSIGARSHHERPAATISTPEKPQKMMQAISYLGSSLKTSTSERSYPTLRGHPPNIEIGKHLEIPSILQKPETGISIEIPPDSRHIFVVSPLAYYLGADLEPGETPLIKTNFGFEYILEDKHGNFESQVEKVLKQCFFLDCLTRTEGYYPVNLWEREQFDKKFNFDFSNIYDRKPGKRLERFVELPFDKIESLIPTWNLKTTIEIAPSKISYIPFLINDLSIIRSAQYSSIERSSPEFSGNDSEHSMGNSDEVEKFLRQKTVDCDDLWRSSSRFNSTVRMSGGIEEPESYIKLPSSEASQQAWVGDGFPLNAVKAMMTAFHNRLSRTAIERDIEISVVVNDSEMLSEGELADEIYSSRSQLSFDVTIYKNLTKDELTNIFSRDKDFLHYIGHIDQGGFECRDGRLDVKEINSTGIDVFLLNACSSYQQATELINSGAIAGIATVRPILNSGAERVGKVLAKLLNLGYPIATALEIAKTESIMGENYIVIGDGGVNLVQESSGIPSLCNISRGNPHSLDYITYTTRKRGLGTITKPYVNSNDLFYLASGKTGNFQLGTRELIEFLSKGEFPVKLNSRLFWSSENELIKELE